MGCHEAPEEENQQHGDEVLLMMSSRIGRVGTTLFARDEGRDIR